MTGSGSPRWPRSSLNTAICNSWSKSLGLPGERIGYLALSPQLDDAANLRGACAFCNRTLGFINAPAIWQWVMLESLDETIDPSPYEHKRNVLCDALAAIGYEVRRPEGAFYVFLKTPIADDIAFTKRLAEEGVLAVPGYWLWTLRLHSPFADDSVGADHEIDRRIRARLSRRRAVEILKLDAPFAFCVRPR